MSTSAHRPEAEPRPSARTDRAFSGERRAPALGSSLLLLLGTVVVLLLVAEGTLRLSGFSFVLYPEDIEFGRPDPVMMKAGFLDDDDLFWVTRDYPEKLARLERERPPLLLLGDSCTHLGEWDERLGELADQRLGADLALGNLAVAGWSSYQGRRQLERDAAPLSPRVVTIFFGWNDHWIGFGLEDETVAEVKRIFSSRWSRLRLVQLVTKATVVWRARETGYPNRVSLEDFADNLRAMVETARQAGAVPVLLTAPSNHVVGQEPAELTERWLREAADLVPLHQSYVEAVRAVARETGAPLCDLARRFADLPRSERDRLFSSDGIHFTPAGDHYLAEQVFACFERDALWPRLLSNTAEGHGSDSPGEIGGGGDGNDYGGGQDNRDGANDPGGEGERGA